MVWALKWCSKVYTKHPLEKPTDSVELKWAQARVWTHPEMTQVSAGNAPSETQGAYFLALGKMSSSLAVGKNEPFQMSSDLTRVLVLKASDTCEAIKDKRGPLT